MNYEEMLSSGNVQMAKGALLPIGFLHKKLRMIDSVAMFAL